MRKMDSTRKRPSLENKLLTSLSLQSQTPLFHSKLSLGGLRSDCKPKKELLKTSGQVLSTRSLLGGGTPPIPGSSKDGRKLQLSLDKPKAVENALLTSSIGKELTENKLLKRPTILLSSKEPQKSKSRFREEGISNDFPPKTSKLSAVHSVNLNTMVSCHNLAFSKLKTENSLLKSSSLTTRPTAAAPTPGIKSHRQDLKGQVEWKADDVDDKHSLTEGDELQFFEMPQSRPIYELEFYEESFFKELSGRITDDNDFKAKDRGKRDPEAEKQQKFLQHTKVAHCRLHFLLFRWSRFSIQLIVLEVIPVLPV